MKKTFVFVVAALFAIAGCKPTLNPDHGKEPEEQGNEQQGNENQGNENQGNEQQGNEGQGNEGQGNEGQGNTGNDNQEGWDGKTFVDKSADWGVEFENHGNWWSFNVKTCTAPYHLIKYIMEGEDFMGAPESMRYSPVDIEVAYTYFCVNVDESYLVNAVSSALPDMEELLWPTGYGKAQGYVFGFDKDKKFTGEYAHLESEHVF